MRRRGSSELLSLLLVLLVVAGGAFAAYRIFWGAPALERARKALKAGRREEAVKLLRAALDEAGKAGGRKRTRGADGDGKAPLDPGLPFLLGSVEDALGRPDAAISAYERCLEAAPDHVEARLAVGRLWLRAGDLRKSESAFRKILAADPKHATANFEMGRLHAVEGTYYVAIDYYRKAAEADPAMLDAHLDLARICGFMEKTDDGIAACEAAIRAHPDCGLAHALLGGFYLRQKKFKEARDVCNRAIGFQADLPEAFLNLGVGCLGTDLVDAAEQQLQKAVALRPGEAAAHYYLGLVDLARKNRKAAAAKFETALSLLKAQKSERKILVNAGDIATVERALRDAKGK